MKKLLALFLATVMAFSLLIPAVFAEDDTCECGFSPIIYVAALGSATLYENAGTPDEHAVFRPEDDATKELIFSLIIPLLKLLIVKDYDSFADSLIDSLYDYLGALEMDADGNSSDKITTKTELPTDSAHGIGKSYYFGYDFRIDPIETAKKLNAYIEHVKELAGHDIVNLRASSMGGVVTMSYIRLFGTGAIDSCIFQCCPIQGTAVAGEIMTGKLEVNADAVVRYASQALPELENDSVEKPLSVLIKVLDLAGVFDSIAGFAETLIDEIGEQLYDEFLIPVFGRMPGLWSFVPDEYYADAKAMMLGDSVSQTLLNRLDFYHYEVQSKATELLQKAVANKIRIMIVAGCNMQRTPLVSAWENDSDATVDTKYATVGGTVAPLLSTFGDGYVQAIPGNKNYVSLNNRYDASTCALPNYTWFIDRMMHSSTHAGHMEFYNKFFLDDGDFNVFIYDEYPQYLINDYENEKLLPME